MYQVPKSKASIGQNKFEFEMPSGKKYSIPLIQYLSPLHAAAVTEGRNITSISKLLNDLAPGAFEQFEDLQQFNVFLDTWTAQSTSSLGESQASSIS